MVLFYLHFMKQLFLFILLFVRISLVNAQQVIPLYGGNVPNFKSSIDEEKSVIGSDSVLRIEAVQKPSLMVYLPSKEKANGAAVIICPGGGYRIITFEKEGTIIAKKLNEWGVTAFVLKYRIPNDKWMLHRETGPLQDAQRAIQIVRQNFASWDIDTNRIGIMGFSAGGHLASSAATHFQKNYIENPGNTNLRPDFQILIYPVISFIDSICHMGSRENLIGKNPSPDKIKEYSGELQVTAATPAAFLMHATDDKTVNSLNSIYYYEALIKNKIPAELHIYEKGGHGFGMYNKTTNDMWIDRLYNWMKANGWLDKNKN